MMGILQAAAKNTRVALRKATEVYPAGTSMAPTKHAAGRGMETAVW